jgi:hypothetical protein
MEKTQQETASNRASADLEIILWILTNTGRQFCGKTGLTEWVEGLKPFTA